MKIDRVIGIIGGVFILAGIGAALFLPRRRNGIKMQIPCRSGADIPV